MSKRVSAFIFSYLILAFYIGIIMFALFCVAQAWRFVNCPSAVAFQAIGFIILALVLYCVAGGRMKIGYAVPLVLTTVIYTAVLDVICFVLLASAPVLLYILFNLILLLVYFLISVPMLVVGRK